jgi:catechol 2,3-dioxygenase-like lactoylglutathione lyase family enzyme
MAVDAGPQGTICKLARFGLTTPDAAKLAAFYERACGFRRLQSSYLSHVIDGVERSITLGLGAEILELLEFKHAGRPYPRTSSAADILFQHFALAVSDVEAAFRQLSAVTGWTAISTEGPQRLPATSGGVTAFKFRDPDGHPLELLAFPPDKVPPRWRRASDGKVCMGIDHSAISVRHSRRSIAFYARLGLHVEASSRNSGPEQARLDGIPQPSVDVIALAPRETPPHIELLCYESPAQAAALALGDNDVATTRLVLEMCDEMGTQRSEVQQIQDPDGHHLLIIPAQKD